MFSLYSDRWHGSLSVRACLVLCVYLGGGALDVAAESAVAPALQAVTEQRELPLEELLAYAGEHAPSLDAVRRRRGYAKAEAASAERALADNPVLELAAGPRFEGGQAGAFDFAAALRQPIEIGGERDGRLAAAARSGERADAEVRAEAWQVRHRVVLAYWQAVVARQRVVAAERVQRLAASLLEVAQRRLDAGEGTLIDLRLAEVAHAKARLAWTQAQNELSSARVRLAAATNWSLTEPPWVSAELLRAAPLPPLERLQRAARETHPELRARRARVQEARARVEVAEREAWAKPVLGVQVSREGSSVGASNTIVLGLVEVPLPLFQRNQGERARTRVDEAVAVAEQTAVERELDAEVALAYAQVLAAEQSIAVLETSVEPNLEESLLLLQKGFDSGELPLVSVAVARERFLSSRSDVLNAYEAYYRALADLEFESGQAFEFLPVSAALEAKP